MTRSLKGTVVEAPTTVVWVGTRGSVQEIIVIADCTPRSFPLSKVSLFLKSSICFVVLSISLSVLRCSAINSCVLFGVSILLYGAGVLRLSNEKPYLFVKCKLYVGLFLF